MQLVVAALTRRIVEAARYVPLERLCLSPQCGFSSTVRGNEITEADQWAKLERLVEGRARSGNDVGCGDCEHHHRCRRAERGTHTRIGVR